MRRLYLYIVRPRKPFRGYLYLYSIIKEFYIDTILFWGTHAWIFSGSKWTRHQPVHRCVCVCVRERERERDRERDREGFCDVEHQSLRPSGDMGACKEYLESLCVLDQFRGVGRWRGHTDLVHRWFESIGRQFHWCQFSFDREWWRRHRWSFGWRNNCYCRVHSGISKRQCNGLGMAILKWINHNYSPSLGYQEGKSASIRSIDFGGSGQFTVSVPGLSRVLPTLH